MLILAFSLIFFHPLQEGEDEEVGNLQLAWEMLEVAKVIYQRYEGLWGGGDTLQTCNCPCSGEK